MQPFIGNLEKLAEKNPDYRHVLFTGAHSQVVAMKLELAQEIGRERHEVDQVFMLVDGAARFDVDGAPYEVKAPGIVVVPAGAWHNVVNVGHHELRLLTIYAPAQHPAGTIQHTKAEADRAETLEHLVPA
jgi:mannose-6-phosphate isomerase-like protein (cupin superfamily)